MKRGTTPMRRSRLKSKKTEWDHVRIKLKPRFERAGITRCEICGGNFAMGFAHAVKRADLKKDAEVGSPEHIETVILACNEPCHARLDQKMSHEEMKNEVMEVINARKQTVT